MTDNMGEINTIINKLSLVNDNIANIYQRLDDIDKRNANMDYKFNNFKDKVDNMERMYNQRLLAFESTVDKDKRNFKSIDKHEAPLRFILEGVDLLDHTSIFLLRTIYHRVIPIIRILS